LERVSVDGAQVDEHLICAIDRNQDGALGGDVSKNMRDIDADQEYYFLCNRLGSVTALLDADDGGRVLEYYRHTVYGETVVLPALEDSNGMEITPLDLADNFASDPQRVSEEFGNVYLFAGRRFDDLTGLYYFRNRYYDARSGRFLSRDPTEYHDGFNQYQYAHANPINWIDPLGLAGKNCCCPGGSWGFSNGRSAGGGLVAGYINMTLTLNCHSNSNTGRIDIDLFAAGVIAGLSGRVGVFGGALGAPCLNNAIGATIGATSGALGGVSAGVVVSAAGTIGFLDLWHSNAKLSFVSAGANLSPKPKPKAGNVKGVSAMAVGVFGSIGLISSSCPDGVCGGGNSGTGGGTASPPTCPAPPKPAPPVDRSPFRLNPDYIGFLDEETLNEMSEKTRATPKPPRKAKPSKPKAKKGRYVVTLDHPRPRRGARRHAILDRHPGD